MKIQEIQIDQFGAWRDLHLSLSRHNMTVFYGSNGAGKSTLMRFVRGMFYGFPSDLLAISSSVPQETRGWKGTVKIQHQGQHWTITRQSETQGQERLSVSPQPTHRTPEEQLQSLLAGIDERLYESIFAVGLPDLQELATLEMDEVTRRIHGLTLGPEGDQLIKFSQYLASPQCLGEPAQKMQEWRQWEQELTGQIQSLTAGQQQYRTLSENRNRLETQVQELRDRQNELQGRLKFLQSRDRLAKPWKELRRCRAELDQLPRGITIPENGRQRVAEIENELKALDEKLGKLKTGYTQLRERVAQLPRMSDSEKQVATLKSLLEQKAWAQQIQTAHRTASESARTAKQSLDQILPKLGKGWSIQRLESTEPQAGIHYRLMAVARKYQVLTGRQKRLKKKYDRLSEKYNHRSAEITTQLKTLGGTDVQKTLADIQARIGELEDLRRLRVRETELTLRQSHVLQQLEVTQHKDALPQWVYTVLGMFAVVGLILSCLGFYTGVTTSGISGLIYFLLGLTGVGMAWGLKTHFEGESQLTLEKLEVEKQEIEVRLKEARDAIGRLTRGSLSPAKTRKNEPPQNETELILQETRRLAELQGLIAKEEKLQTLRKFLSKLRGKHQLLQRETGTARQAWCDLLKEIGLQESLKVGEVFLTWDHVAKASTLLQSWKTAKHEADQHQQALQAFAQRMDVCAKELSLAPPDGKDLHKTLTQWEQQSKHWGQSSEQSVQLRRTLKQQKSELQKLSKLRRQLSHQRTLIFMQAGATSREDFLTRSKSTARRSQLQQELSKAEEAWKLALAGESDVEIREEDFLQWEEKPGTNSVAQLTQEIQQIDSKLAKLFEQLGKCKSELAVLGQQSQGTRWKLERQQAVEQLKTSFQQWLAVQLARQALMRVRGRYEKACQPATLARASEFLSRMTHGKYRNLWTPLGQQTLYVDDNQKHTYGLSQLSTGTRDQLFLSLRLAIVEEYRAKGVELPMVLDDVMVNFDWDRTEAVAETLMEFAAEGQQILLFTCHQHLAELFNQHKMDPITLPGRVTTQQAKVA